MQEMAAIAETEEQVKLVDPQKDKPVSKSPQNQRRWKPGRISVISVVCLMGSLLFLVFFTKLYSNGSWNGLDFQPFEDDVEGNYTWPAEKQQEKLLGGLLSEGLDEKSCRSRYLSALYRKGITRLPSSHLISKLRRYEALHKRCGPYTESFNRSLEYFKSGKFNSSADPADCKYIIWLTRAGLGNRMITLASTFLYALLTDRVFLVDLDAHFPDLFCEPFPEATWLVPSDFPITQHQFTKFDKNSWRSFGNLLRRNGFGSSKASLVPSYVYVHLVSDYGDYDKHFFCDKDQNFLQKVPWLLIRSDLYFAPSLFLMPSFQQVLNDMFPDKETVFHFLGRYLFHPANTVWRAISKYYNTYLAKADEKIGIQVRVLHSSSAPFKQVMHQILGCVNKENILPKINETLKLKEIPVNMTGKTRTKAVLITSLTPDYFEAVRDMYREHPTVTGETVEVVQPSHEGYQRSKNEMHNMKAWAEIYLLSLSDKLVTTSKSTFGYVAQSLGDLKPWILYKPEDYKDSDPVCQRGVSMEPCFQAPPFLDCKSKGWIDTSKMVPYVRHCEDMNWNWGLKLFGKDG